MLVLIQENGSKSCTREIHDHKMLIFSQGITYLCEESGEMKRCPAFHGTFDSLLFQYHISNTFYDGQAAANWFPKQFSLLDVSEQISVIDKSFTSLMFACEGALLNEFGTKTVTYKITSSRCKIFCSL